MTAILLIEDDDISRAFLAEAISGPETTVVTCSGFSEALRHCEKSRFDLIVSDINLGDGTLYDMAKHLPAGIPVIATSADIDSGIRRRLADLGIAVLLAKPMSIAELHAGIRNALGKTGIMAEPALWDEQRALQALSQNRAALASLKSLFGAELPEMAETIRTSFDTGEYTSMHATLHKLKASCGFIGANRLLAACNALDQRPCTESLAVFLTALEQTLATLWEADGSAHR